MKDNASLLLLLIKIIDSIIIITSGLLCFYILEPIKHFPAYDGYLPENYLTLIVLGFIFSSWWFPVFKVYQSWRGTSLFLEIRALLLGWSCSLLGLLTFIFFTKTATDFSRHWFLLWFATTFLVLLLIHIVIRGCLRILRNKGFNTRHIVLVGGGKLNDQVAEKIQNSPWMGLKIQGFFSDTKSGSTINIPHLGEIKNVFNYVEKNNIDQIWITLPLKEMDLIEDLCRQLHTIVVEIKLIPDISSLRLLNYSTTQIDGMTLINMSISPMSNTNRLLKWMEDKIFSLIILILISPLLLVIAITIKLTSTGPVLYRQERIGNHGKKFLMFKFRSMPTGSDKSFVWGNARSKQKTKIGQFLRKTNLDELPQFINVLKGEMSIVGPRPERTIFVEQFKHEINNYMQKHLVHAGITGWAQINGFRGDTCLHSRLEYDLYYIENWSLGFDLKIIALTFYKGFNNAN